MTRAEDRRSKLSLRGSCGGFRGAKPTMLVVLQDEAKKSHARTLLADHDQDDQDDGQCQRGWR